jgi:hypothetical protein
MTGMLLSGMLQQLMCQGKQASGSAGVHSSHLRRSLSLSTSCALAAVRATTLPASVAACASFERKEGIGLQTPAQAVSGCCFGVLLAAQCPTDGSRSYVYID